MQVGVDGQGAIEAYLDGFAEIPHVSDIAAIDGRPTLIGVVPILPENGDVEFPRGRALFPDGPDLMARADFALYEAKEAGRNRHKVFGERNEDSPTIPVPMPANANKVA